MAMILNYSNTHLRLLKNKIYQHRWAILFTLFLALLLIVHSTSVYRGAISFPRAHWNNGNSFDDAANTVALNNFKNYGFIASRGNENRKGMVLQDYFSIPCLDDQGRRSQPRSDIDRYKDIDGFEVPLIAKNQNCYYHRTPPLHLWINYSLLTLTDFNSRTLPITTSILMALWVYALYLFISQFASKYSALMAAIFFAMSMEFLGWSQASYNQPYQNLFFTLALYYFHRLINQGRGGAELLLFSAAHALCTFELVPMQLTYMLLALVIRNPRPWKSVYLGVGGIFLALGLFALWISIFAIDQMDLMQLLRNSMDTRYPQTLDPVRWFSNQWYETFNILSGTLYSGLAVIMFLLIIYFCSSSKDRVERFKSVVALFISAWAFHFILPGHASYHVFILSKAFIPFYLVLMALAIDAVKEWLENKEKVFRYAALIVAMIMINHAGHQVSNYIQYYWTSSEAVGKQNKARESIGYLVSFYPMEASVVKIAKNLKWQYYYFKNRLLDGSVPDRKGQDWRWAVTINKALGIDFDWFYLQPNKFHTIEVISSPQMQSGDCTLHMGNGNKLGAIAIEHESVEIDQFWHKRVYRFKAIEADWVRWSCRSKNNFNLYELRLL